MSYKIRSRTGFCVYSEKNEDYGKFLDDLRNSRVQFYGLVYNKDKLYGYVRSFDYELLKKKAGEYDYKTEKISRKGLWYSSGKLRSRIGIVVGFLATVMLICFLCTRVMIIEIGGNKELSRERIIDLLSDVGLGYGSSISSADLRAAEHKILSMEKKIEWIGIRNIGSRLIVEISEITNAPEINLKNTPSNIIAMYDAQITQVRLYSGMLIPMIGDGVKKGDIIVSGVVDEKYGEYHYVHSIAEITGIYSKCVTFSVPFITEESLQTDVVRKKGISIFGKRFYYLCDGNVTGEYEYIENEKNFSVGKIVLPFSLIDVEYKIKDTVITERNEEEILELISQKTEAYEENFIASDVKLLDKKTEQFTDEKNISVKITYTLEGEIGTQKSFFASYE